MSSKTLGKAIFTKDIKGILEVYRSDIPDILVTDI